METSEIKKQLQQTYFSLLIPAVLLIVVFFLLKRFDLNYSIDENTNHTISIIFFIIGAVFSLALPIFYKSLFINRVKDEKGIRIDEFLKFEKNIISISMISPFIVIFPVIFNFSNFYFSGIVLFAFYSAYYFFPSDKRIDFEKKLF